ncbi:putative adenylyltransferase/sulfurtransferase MoeZ [mine drainage metagenome]|uniref:Putative adenylyltransferase/sulfurtransferase MoeZ n=1 Tax=mine drainage metagenome TaxID=410659 RepID=A0A1J5R4C9_9ZZZZ
MTGYTEISAEELHGLLAENSITLIDVRNDDEAARGIIPGARHIPLHMIPLRANDLSGEQPLVFYCHAGVRSAQAASFMASRGREHIYNLQGGVMAWGKAEYPFAAKK